MPADDSADLVVWTMCVSKNRPPQLHSYSHMNRVEGNTLIIASCIPVMGPLVELALGRRVLSSTDRKYQKQSDSAGLRSGAVELHGNLTRTGNIVGKPPVVVRSGHSLDKASSQESILDGHSEQGRTHPTGILRTDTVSVCFDSQDTARKGNTFNSSKWNQV